MDPLRRALENDPAVTLDVAVLAMAEFESPALDAPHYLGVLDRFAGELRARLGTYTSGARFVQIANEYLFGELGFRGDERAYHDPRSSCLNWVLDLHAGLPITLSVVYLEVARRLQRPVFGIGLPGHFIVRYDDGEFSAYIDPFHGGKLLTEEDCRAVARDITGTEIGADSSAFEPVGTRYIIVRMLNNLRAAYLRSRQFAKCAAVLDLLIEYFPSNPEYYNARGVVRLKLRKLAASRDDFQKYLQYAPDASDRNDVTRQMQAIHQSLARLN